ncbi:hypothetical protein OCK72_08935 [Fusobacterium simiae]|uniref:Uncharacterized protein n=1 Tax=Fusobacterium simiae TaxID=855 RepID=A0ABT4DL70_FUSSI|nr:hypothetical protein [Fusobacterium simiae]MCY7008748.1 hypothetical protein [Fusobacterium simiae]
MNIVQLIFKRKNLSKLNKYRFKKENDYLYKIIKEADREPCYIMGDLNLLLDKNGIPALKIPPREIIDKYDESKKVLFEKICDDYNENPEKTLKVLFGKIKADRLYSMNLSNKKLDKLIKRGGLEYYSNLVKKDN